MPNYYRYKIDPFFFIRGGGVFVNKESFKWIRKFFECLIYKLQNVGAIP
jgi:hypothetical protein